MVRIYKDDNSKKVIVEGVHPEFASLLDYWVTDGFVTIYHKGLKKSIFNDKWENIGNKLGVAYTNRQELLDYLGVVFALENITTNNTEPLMVWKRSNW